MFSGLPAWAPYALVALVCFGLYLWAKSSPAASTAIAAGRGLLGLVPRAATLLKHINSLGLTVLDPVLRAIAAGRWSDVPGLFHLVLDQLDDSTQRKAILDNLFYADLERRLGDDAKRADFIERLKKLGLKSL